MGKIVVAAIDKMDKSPKTQLSAGDCNSHLHGCNLLEMSLQSYAMHLQLLKACERVRTYVYAVSAAAPLACPWAAYIVGYAAVAQPSP